MHGERDPISSGAEQETPGDGHAHVQRGHRRAPKAMPALNQTGSLLKKWGLLWLSPKDVVRVRNGIISLYLHPNESLSVPAPRGYLSTVSIYSGPYPLFTWTHLTEQAGRIVSGGLCKAWLKCPRDRNPYWDFQKNEAAHIERLRFRAPECRLPATIVKHFATYFPFLPSDNYFTHDKDHFYA